MGKNKILIIGKRPWQQMIIENALKMIFKREPKFYIEHTEIKDALLDLCLNQNKLLGVFCFHSDEVNGIQLFKDWKQVARVKSIPFVLILKEQFKSTVKEAEEAGIICVQFHHHSTTSQNLAEAIVKVILKKR